MFWSFNCNMNVHHHKYFSVVIASIISRVYIYIQIYIYIYIFTYIYIYIYISRVIYSYHHIIYFSSYNLHILQKNPIYCLNIFVILNNKIHIGFSNEKGFAESHYGFVIKPLSVSRFLRTHSWNILKVCNFNAKRKQLKSQFRFKKRKWVNFFLRILEKVIPYGGPAKWDSEFAFAKRGFRNFTVKFWKICWVFMRDFLKTYWKC